MKKDITKDIFIGYLSAPALLAFLIIVTKYISEKVYKISNEPFIYVFIPLSITFFLMGLTSLVFKVNVFSWIFYPITLLLPDYSYSWGINPMLKTDLSEEPKDWKVARAVAISFLSLGLITMIFSVLIIVNFF